jgi:hypothetical protein
MSQEATNKAFLILSLVLFYLSGVLIGQATLTVDDTSLLVSTSLMVLTAALILITNVKLSKGENLDTNGN